MSDETEREAAEREAELLAQLEEQRRLARVEDYIFDKAQEAFWDIRNGTLHSEKAVDASIPQELWRVVTETPPERPEGARGRPPQPRERLVPPSKDILRVENDQFVEGSTWWPGRPEMIRNIFIDDSGSRPSHGARIYNQYRPPPKPPETAKAEEADRWIKHVQKLWPDEQEHTYFFDYCAHMLQRPEQKANAAIVMSGTQGIGKDAALYPVRAALGAWNVKSIDPDDLFAPFKPWLQTLMLVINEVRPTKDEFHASSMYNIMKPLIAAPPDTLPLNDKNQKLRYVVNVMRVFLTTNDWMAMYIPPEDRRMFIMHSLLAQKWHETEGRPQYFVDLFTWFDSEGGCDAVAAWLLARDVRAFNPKAPPVKTAGWDAVAGTWEEPEDGVAYALNALGYPDVVFGTELADPQFDYYEDVVGMLKSPRKIGHRMQKAGYLMVKSPDGRWTFGANGRQFRARLAFVKQSAGLTNGKALNAIAERGRLIAAAMPSSDPRGDAAEGRNLQ